MHPFAADLSAILDLARETERAAQLLKEVRAGDAVAAARFRFSHARFAWMPDEAIGKAARASDTRFIVAREYGFGSWARLRDYLKALAGRREVRQPFDTDLQYYRDRAAGMLSVFGTGERNALRLVRQFHPNYANASEAEIRAAKLTQADAELILACEHGFETFDAFSRYIGALRKGPRRTARSLLLVAALATLAAFVLPNLTLSRPEPIAAPAPAPSQQSVPTTTVPGPLVLEPAAPSRTALPPADGPPPLASAAPKAAPQTLPPAPAPSSTLPRRAPISSVAQRPIPEPRKQVAPSTVTPPSSEPTGPSPLLIDRPSF